MDVEQAGARIKRGAVGGLLYAHTYGEKSMPNDFFHSLKSLQPEILIVDDRCLCIPEFESDSLADMVLFSTGYAKIVELNFGGYAFVKEEINYQPAELKFDPNHHTELEKLYKDAIQNQSQFVYRDSDWLQTNAQLLEWDMYQQQIESALESSLAQRKTLNEIYSSRLPKDIQLPPEYQMWRFNIRVKNKQQIMDEIFANGLFASSHYASLAGIMSDRRAPVAESLADDVINLFNDHHFTIEMAERVCEIIVKYRT